MVVRSSEGPRRHLLGGRRTWRVRCAWKGGVNARQRKAAKTKFSRDRETGNGKCACVGLRRLRTRERRADHIPPRHRTTDSTEA